MSFFCGKHDTTVTQRCARSCFEHAADALLLGLELDCAVAGHLALHKVEKLVKANQTVVVVPQLSLLPDRLLLPILLLSCQRTRDKLELLRRWLLCAIQTEGDRFLHHEDVVLWGRRYLPPLNKLNQLLLSKKRVLFHVSESNVLLLVLGVPLHSAAQKGLPAVYDLLEGCAVVGEV